MARRELPNFRTAVEELDKSDTKRAERLRVSTRTLSRYKAGDLPPPLDVMVDEAPDLLAALLADALNRKNTIKNSSV